MPLLVLWQLSEIPIPGVAPTHKIRGVLKLSLNFFLPSFLFFSLFVCFFCNWVAVRPLLSAPWDKMKPAVSDDELLASMGHKAELKRNFSPLAMLGLAFAILNSWTALSASLNLALPSGGPTSVIWGLVTAGICNMSLALSLAEFLSAYPTAGGQYHWVAVISWKSWVPILSWITGWINVAGWIALVASGGLLGSQLIVGVITFMNPTYVPQAWHQFLIYIAYNLIAFLINGFMTAVLPLITKTAFIWSIAGFVIISITVLACASPTYSSGDVVFREFINQTGGRMESHGCLVFCKPDWA